ncbi:adenylate/guanylate cyclase domain-containing protein [Streptomyces sp. NPDC059680]|uniref:adenylate/guanylate cyclase domain-containing protein n=1 Tax=Streptomyces sp. NPDC059680 TaxID=3346904 RepID=UPI0036BE14BC
MNCATCQQQGPADAHFCPYCGERYTDEEAYEVRRVVSVVFCDLVGSTALSEQLDPEPLRSLVGSYYQRMRHTLEHYGGTVEKFIGDAVVGLFGVPRLHEDDALRAVQAAVAMRHEVELLDHELSEQLNVRLQVRIGVNTGEVMASGYGDNVRVTGEMVNIAARFQQAAEPGQVVIGLSTRALVGGAVLLEPLPALQLAGKSRPVDAWIVSHINPDASGIERHMNAPLTGRMAELRFLYDTFEHMQFSQSPKMVTIYGEPGIGKSRLVHEFLAVVSELAGERAQLYITRCSPLNQETWQSPLLGVLTELAGKNGDTEPELQAAVAALATHSHQTADDVLWVARKLFATAAAQHSVIIFIDDIHWAKPLLLDVVRRLGNSLREVPVMLLCVSRLDILDHYPTWSGGNLNAASILVAPLAREATEQIVRNQFATSFNATVDDAIVYSVSERSGGNPLYIEQLVGAVNDGADPVTLPPTIRALIETRLQWLDLHETALLQWVAVCGMESTAEWLEILLDQPNAQPTLDRLMDRQLLESIERSYRFRNIQIREVTYESIPKRTRAQMHQRIAELLIQQQDDTAAEAISRHLEYALSYYHELGIHEKAQPLHAVVASTLTEAAQLATTHGDLRATSNLLRRALKFAPETDPTRIRILTQLGATLVAMTQLDEARATYEEAMAAALRHANCTALAHARLGLIQLPSLDATAEEILHTAAAAESVFTAVSDAEGLMKTHTLQGHVHQSRGQYLDAVNAFKQAGIHAYHGVDELQHAQTVGGYTFSLWRGPTPVPQAIEQCESLLASVPASCRLVRVAAMGPLSVLLASRGKMPEAEQLLLDAEHLISEFAHEFARISLSVFTATVKTLARDPTAAEDRLRSACAALERVGGTTYTAAATDLARVLLRLGRTSEATKILFDPTKQHGKELPAEWFGLQARVHLSEGRWKASKRSIQTALRLASATDSPEIQAVAWLDQAYVLRATGREQQARRAATLALAQYQAKAHLIGIRQAEDFIERGEP